MPTAATSASGPRTTSFIGNGVVLADRGLTPKMQEVKFLFQPAEVLPDDTGVTIRNRRLFDDAG